MASRRPLYVNADNDLQEMSDAQITAVQNRCRYLYGANPSVTLSRVASGGDLGSISDTRKRAGAGITRVDRFATQAETGNVDTVTVNYSRVEQANTNTTASADTNSRAFPIYYNGTDIQAMTLTDMYDTFIEPAIDTITASVGQPGTYRVHTSTSLSGYTAVSTSAIFSDTRANASAYTAGGLNETRDQPTTITNFYLLKANNISAPSHERPLFIDSSGNLEKYTQAEIDAILENCIRHTASERTGTRIRYRWSTAGSGTNLGSGITNTILNGTGVYRTRYVNTNDYRAQEHPNGTAITANTYYLRMYQV
jgi:hypothetical protein